jgi:protein-tyrosine phosphatase
MIFDSSTSPAVIIMLTQPVEANREKCFQYYPLDMTSPVLDITDPEDPSFGITITMQSIHEDDSTQTTIRELLLRSADGTREKKVWHLLYASWPDFLVPEGEDRDALLRLVKFSQKLAASEQQSSSNQEQPERIVHCSAGVGRTGTFIALDWLIDELDAGALDRPAPVEKGGADESGEVDESTDDLVVDLVDRLRQQRMMMIQGEMQFGFLYEVLGDLWLQRWKVNHGTE